MNDSKTIFTAMTPIQARQGDVFITPALKAINPADIGDLIKDGNGSRIVLAYGEVTGHAHAFYPALDVDNALAASGFSDAAHREVGKHKNAASSIPAQSPVSLHVLRNPQQYSGSTLPAESQRLLRIRQRSVLRHEEHSAISLPPGDYIVIQQFEGDEAEELRKVAD